MTELPTTFGKYYLTEKLATGGMAEIYLAKLIGPGGFEKQLVIKQIQPALSGQRHFVDLFVAEAKTLVALTHGNIVPVYELGVVDDTYFIAMDYIDGPTLYRLTETMAGRDARMDPAVAAWISARMLEGLDYAHRKGEGVIHRDLSPRNVMLSRDGEVKLVDFGIAVTLGAPGEDAGKQSAPTGSFPYMSPEQVRREALTAQTDLFTVGVLLWEMLTGRRLFVRADQDATLAAVLGEPVPAPSTVRPEIPARLDEVVMRALERDRSARWPSAGDMLGAINKYLYALDDTPGPRDVAALVAKYCPPETRRLPTHLEALAHTDAGAATSGDDTPSPAGPSTAVLPREPAGPATAVVPRDAGARGRPQRHKSFATNVDLAPLLVDDTPATSTTEPSPRRSPGRLDRAEQPLDHAHTGQDAHPGAVVDNDAPIPRPPPSLPVPGRNPPSFAALVLLGIGVIALGIAAVVVFFRGRDAVLASDRDAAVIGNDAASDEATAPDADTAFDAGHADAVVANTPRDADVAHAASVVDASVRQRDAVARADAMTVAPAVPADAAVAAGTATLKVGADPWGDIYIDGKPMGRTPRELSVVAGHHTVEIVFPAETPPRKQTFGVDLTAGETKPLQADFSN